MYLLQKNLLLPLVVFPQLYLYAIHWFDECGLRLSISIDWLWGLCFPISTQFNALKKSLPCFVLLDRAWDVCFREDYSVLHVSTWFPDVSSSRDGLGIALPGYLPIHCYVEKRLPTVSCNRLGFGSVLPSFALPSTGIGSLASEFLFLSSGLLEFGFQSFFKSISLEHGVPECIDWIVSFRDFISECRFWLLGSGYCASDLPSAIQFLQTGFCIFFPMDGS